MLKPRYSILVKITSQVPQAVVDTAEAYLAQHNEQYDDKADIDYLVRTLLEDWAEKQSKSPKQENETDGRRGRKPKANQGEHLQIVSQTA